MSEENGLRRERHGLRHNLPRGHRPEFRIQKPDFMSRVEQRPADGQQAQWRQMLVGNEAADSRMRRSDQQNAYEGLPSSLAGRILGSETSAHFEATRFLSARPLQRDA